MLTRKLTGIAAAATLLLSGGAIAGESGYPGNVSEAAPLSIPLETSRHMAGGAGMTASAFPSSPSEAPRFTFSAEAMTPAPARLGTTYGSVFPRSVNETGPRI